MENFIFISPDFPKNYDKFCERLKSVGFNVLAIGSSPYDQISQKLRDSVSEYYYCPHLDDYESVYRAVAFLIFKYGKIKYLESNNEHWLESDASLRRDFNIEGLSPSELIEIKHKSKMKDYYRLAGVKCASFALVKVQADFDDFLEDYGYPLFIKPDVGVGAKDSYKINNDEEKKTFFQSKKDFTYIVEPFIEGTIVSFDATIDLNGDIVFATSHVFPVANNEIALGSSDDYYYSTPTVDKDLFALGERVAKAFAIKGRNIHLEFFKLTKDTTFAKKGEYIGLEVNMRSPGAYIPDMISQASGVDYYDIYARMMKGLKVDLAANTQQNYALQVSRRKEEINNYLYSDEEIKAMYQNNITDTGTYPEILAAGMGDFYYVGLFPELNAALDFKNDVLKRKI